MNSAMAIVKVDARYRQRYAAKEMILKKFAVDPSIKHRTTTKIVKMVLLNGPYTFDDKLYEIKAKSLGAGVYELSAEEQK